MKDGHEDCWNGVENDDRDSDIHEALCDNVREETKVEEANAEFSDGHGGLIYYQRAESDLEGGSQQRDWDVEGMMTGAIFCC